MNRPLSMAAMLILSCAPPLQIISLDRAGGAPRPSPGPGLEVDSVSTQVRDPLLVKGSAVAFDDLPQLLAHGVAQGPSARYEGWRLTLEVTDGRAEQREGRFEVRLTTRATLRTRDGSYLAQAQHVCRAADAVEASAGAAVVTDCVQQLTREIDAWLLRLHTQATSPQ